MYYINKLVKTITTPKFEVGGKISTEESNDTYIIADKMFDLLTNKYYTPSKNENHICTIALERMLNDGLLDVGQLDAQDHYWFNERGLLEVMSTKDLKDKYFFLARMHKSIDEFAKGGDVAVLSEAKINKTVKEIDKMLSDGNISVEESLTLKLMANHFKVDISNVLKIAKKIKEVDKGKTTDRDAIYEAGSYDDSSQNDANFGRVDLEAFEAVFSDKRYVHNLLRMEELGILPNDGKKDIQLLDEFISKLKNLKLDEDSFRLLKLALVRYGVHELQNKDIDVAHDIIVDGIKMLDNIKKNRNQKEKLVFTVASECQNFMQKHEDKFADGGDIEIKEFYTKAKFELNDANSKEDIKENVDIILKNYRGRELAYYQVQKYLEECHANANEKEYVKQYLAEINVDNTEKLKEYLASQQSKLRNGVRARNKKSNDEYYQWKAENDVKSITEFALKAGREMDEKIAAMPEAHAEGGDISKHDRGVQIAQNIYNQIGGKAFYMIGAKNLLSHGKENALSFRVRGSTKVNYIKITLNSMDLYDMEFGKIHGDKYKIVAEENGVYNDMLKPLIEKHTELYTKLFNEGGEVSPVGGFQKYEDKGKEFNDRVRVYYLMDLNSTVLFMSLDYNEVQEKLKEHYEQGKKGRTGNNTVPKDDWKIGVVQPHNVRTYYVPKMKDYAKGGAIQVGEFHGELVFQADTTGGKYSIMCRQESDEDYTIYEYKNQKLTGHSAFFVKEVVADKIIESIVGAAIVDGINYKIAVDKLGVTEQIEEEKKRYKARYSNEFNAFRSAIDKDKLKEVEKKAIEKYEEKLKKENFFVTQDAKMHLVRKYYLNMLLDMYLKK